jgi:hypothetical protein
METQTDKVVKVDFVKESKEYPLVLEANKDIYEAITSLDKVVSALGASSKSLSKAKINGLDVDALNASIKKLREENADRISAYQKAKNGQESLTQDSMVYNMLDNDTDREIFLQVREKLNASTWYGKSELPRELKDAKLNPFDNPSQVTNRLLDENGEVIKFNQIAVEMSSRRMSIVFIRFVSDVGYLERFTVDRHGIFSVTFILKLRGKDKNSLAPLLGGAVKRELKDILAQI